MRTLEPADAPDHWADRGCSKSAGDLIFSLNRTHANSLRALLWNGKLMDVLIRQKGWTKADELCSFF